jgi:hypothetical protein
MSALPPKADMDGYSPNVRFVPTADIGRLKMPHQANRGLSQRILANQVKILCLQVCSVAMEQHSRELLSRQIDRAGFMNARWSGFGV